MTAFISGHLSLTQEEFKRHYRPLIDIALKNGHAFVVGDAKGTDALSQEYLSMKNPKKVIVHHMFEKPRNYASGKFIKMGGFTSDSSRDRAMTAASDYDIAWVRPGREKSGTQKNLNRRNKS